MPKFSTKTPSQYPVEETYEKIKDYIHQQQGQFKSFDPNLELEFDDQNYCGNLHSKKLKVEFTIEELETSQCDVVVHIDLPLLLTPLKGKIVSMLENQLKERLQAQ